MINITKLEKYYGKHVGVRNVSFDVESGEIFGFVGPNGAGKSTTIKVLMGLIFSSSGSATINNLDVAKNSKEIKTFTGYVPSEVKLYATMKVGELLKRNESFYNTDCSSETNRLCSLFEVDLNKRFSELSTGNKKKVSLVCALMANPKVIILDEPTNGLDPMMQERLFEELKIRKNQGVAILLSSHNLSEVQEYCDRVAFIKDGEILTIVDLNTERQSSKIVTVRGGNNTTPSNFELLKEDNNKRVFRTVLNGKDLLDTVSTLLPEDVIIENESIEDKFWSLYFNGEDK